MLDFCISIDAIYSSINAKPVIPSRLRKILKLKIALSNWRPSRREIPNKKISIRDVQPGIGGNTARKKLRTSKKDAKKT